MSNAIELCDTLGVPHSLAEIGKERIRHAGDKIKSGSPLTTQNLDTGFRDSSFDGSFAKINVTEIFKLLAPDIRIQVI